MSILDIVISGIMVIAVIYGLKKGLIASILTCVGLISTFILFARFGPMIRAGLKVQYNFGDFFAAVFAYLIIIILVAILVKILTIIFNYVASMLYLTLLNRVSGALFCFFNVVIALMIILILISLFPFFSGLKNLLINNSIIIEEIYNFTDKLMVDYHDRLPQEIQELLN